MDMWTPPDEDFPALTNERYVKKSEPDDGYNCVAWVLGAKDVWIGPPGYGYNWPIPSPALTVENFVAFFEWHGFKRSDVIAFQAGKETIAIYSSGGLFTHVAKLVKNGNWSSKLGEEMDCEHDLRAVEGPFYGTVYLLMEREIKK
ncbi:MAG TPA: hypothetical protein VKX17_00870 [Planctomycetota bacterium]|nr:hypothetical protein [Planctomycetota bacterium]